MERVWNKEGAKCLTCVYWSGQKTIKLFSTKICVRSNKTGICENKKVPQNETESIMICPYYEKK